MLVLLAGIGVGAAFLFWVQGERPDYGFNYYPVWEAVGWLVYGLACTASFVWTARKTNRRGVRCWVGACAVIAALISAALLCDLLYIAVGPGVPPMPDTCVGGMDCIGEPLPGPPLTGSGPVLALAGILSLPVAVITVAAAAWTLDARS